MSSLEVELKMLKRLSGGTELDELVSTARNTYANAGSVAQFDFTDFYQSDKSKVSFPCLSFLSRAHAASSSIFIFFELLFSISSHQSSPLVLPGRLWMGQCDHEVQPQHSLVR